MRRHLVSDSALLAEAAAVSGIAPWDGAPPDEAARALVGDDWARRFQIVPVEVNAHALTIATSTPFDLDCERALAFATGRAVRLLLASPLTIVATLDAVELESDSVARDLSDRGATTGTTPIRLR